LCWLQPAFCCCLLHLQSVIDFFNSRLDSINGGQAAAPEGQADWSVGRVLELVQSFAQVGLHASSNTAALLIVFWGLFMPYSASCNLHVDCFLCCAGRKAEAEMPGHTALPHCCMAAEVDAAQVPLSTADMTCASLAPLCWSCLQSWRGDRLKQLPELRFVYEEEAAPEEFFVPYCWSLAVAATGGRLLAWNLGAVALLTQVAGGEGDEGGLEGQTSNASSAWSEEAMLADSQV
jgi:hypothetical protein